MSCVVLESINAKVLVLETFFVCKSSLFLHESAVFNSVTCFCKSLICCWSMAYHVSVSSVSVSKDFVRSLDSSDLATTSLKLLYCLNLFLRVRLIRFTVFGIILGTLFKYAFFPPAKCAEQILWDAVRV